MSVGTEKYLGEAIRQSGIPREELWINTKLPWHYPALKTVEESLDASLRALGVDYVDSVGTVSTHGVTLLHSSLLLVLAALATSCRLA